MTLNCSRKFNLPLNFNSLKKSKTCPCGVAYHARKRVPPLFQPTFGARRFEGGRVELPGSGIKYRDRDGDGNRAWAAPSSAGCRVACAENKEFGLTF